MTDKGKDALAKICEILDKRQAEVSPEQFDRELDDLQAHFQDKIVKLCPDLGTEILKRFLKNLGSGGEG